jgi:hypothetical protein
MRPYRDNGFARGGRRLPGVVLFLGVRYHEAPLFVLEQLAWIARERIVIETHLDALTRSGRHFLPRRGMLERPQQLVA